MALRIFQPVSMKQNQEKWVDNTAIHVKVQNDCG
jgi:hypothetical protein